MRSWILFLFVVYTDMNFNLIASRYLLVEIEGGYGTKAETPELRAYPSCKTLEFIYSVIRNPYNS